MNFFETKMNLLEPIYKINSLIIKLYAKLRKAATPEGELFLELLPTSESKKVEKRIIFGTHREPKFRTISTKFLLSSKLIGICI